MLKMSVRKTTVKVIRKIVNLDVYGICSAGLQVNMEKYDFVSK